MIANEITLAALCEWRGIETPCQRCHGAGVRAYSSTAMWRGGIGGQMMSSGICDACWGSGDAAQSWLDLRKLAANQRAEIDAAVATKLATMAGTNIDTLRPTVEALIAEIERLSRGRKQRPAYWYNVCYSIIDHLRAGLAASAAGYPSPRHRAHHDAAAAAVWAEVDRLAATYATEALAAVVGEGNQHGALQVLAQLERVAQGTADLDAATRNTCVMQEVDMLTDRNLRDMRNRFGEHAAGAATLLLHLTGVAAAAVTAVDAKTL